MEYTDDSTAAQLHSSRRLALWLGIGLALAGLSLIPAFAVGEAGFPTVTPPAWGVALILVANALFCALATALLYVLFIRPHTADWWLRLALVMALGGILGFIQIFIFVLALLFWQLWVVAMLLVVATLAGRLYLTRATALPPGD